MAQNTNKKNRKIIKSILILNLFFKKKTKSIIRYFMQFYFIRIQRRTSQKGQGRHMQPAELMLPTPAM
jgi:hypothetical protein